MSGEKGTEAASTKVVEPTRARSLVATARVGKGQEIRTLADELALEALTKIGELMRDETESSMARRGAARDIMYIWSRIPPLPVGGDGGFSPGLLVSPEDRRLSFIEMARRRPPELVQALAEAGIVVQPEKETKR